MKRARQIFRGKEATATIIGLICAVAMLIGLMSCGKDDSSKPTSSNIPMFPAGQSSENSNEMGFYSSKGDGQFGAWAGDSSEFLVGVPAGEFLLTYGTTVGTFSVAFRATDAAVLHIGMRENVRVTDVSAQKGTITKQDGGTWPHGAVTLFAWPGSGAAWNSVFQSDGSAAIMLIIGGQAAPGVNKLPGLSSAPNSPSTTIPATTTTISPTTTSATSASTTSTSSTSTSSTSSTSTTAATTTSTADSTTTTVSTTTTTTTTSMPILGGSADVNQNLHWNVNAADTNPVILLPYCAIMVDNIGSIGSTNNIVVTFTNPSSTMTETIPPGQGYGWGIAEECPMSWSAICNGNSIGGTATAYNDIVWEVNSDTCAVNKIEDCEVEVHNTGSQSITIMFSGGYASGTRAILPGQDSMNRGRKARAGECPVSWTLIQ